jgi:ABC-2 type transport system ATP-binding protein
MTNDAIALEGVTKRYGAVRALADLSFSVPPGQMFGLIGPDGAGKTTTIRLLCGLLHADAGRVRLLGHDPVREHAQITRSVGYLSQRFSLYGDLSIDENIAFFAEIHGLRRYETRRDRLLDLTQLRPFRDRLADRLSGGMKQKLALACTLIHEPRVILLDEPTTGVDPVSRREFWKLLSEFLELGITILVSTPYLDEAERCARVALLHEGSLLALDTPDALRASLPGRIVEMIATDQARAVSVAREEPGVADVQTFGERAHARFLAGADVDAAQRLARRFADAGVAIRTVREVPPSLEDVFIARLQEQASPTSRDGRDESRPAAEAAASPPAGRIHD